MPTFRVWVKRTTVNSLDLEAKTLEEALELAYDMDHNNTLNAKEAYSVIDIIDGEGLDANI